ncbi:hypothetical protein PCE1_001661 [Barthelona sp. PCE]
MNKNHFFCFFILFAVVFGISTELTNKITNRESQLNSLVNAAETILSNPSTTTSDCTYNDWCSSGSSGSCTHHNFGNDQRCGCDGRSFVDFSKSWTSTAPSSRQADTMFEELCASLPLDTNFASAFTSDNSLKWQYIGFGSGFFRGYPFVSLNMEKTSSACTSNCCRRLSTGTCPGFDPRTRPWYNVAASGPKNVILVLDVSGSMVTNNRIGLMKTAAKTTINGLTYLDRVSVIKFSTIGQKLGVLPDVMVQAHEDNREIINSAIDSLSPGGVTNFNSAFQAAFDVLDNSFAADNYTDCSTLLLFLTDGAASDAYLNHVDLIQSRVDSLPASRRARFSIHTMALSDSASVALPKQIACGFNGIFTPISEHSDDLVYAMSTYYEFLALGMEATTPVWSEKYVDVSGLGELVAVSMPVYENGTFKGVAGLDLVWSDLTANDTAEEVVTYLQSRSNNCPDYDLQTCTLERLRGRNNNCGLCPHIWKDDNTDDDGGISSGVLIAIGIAVFVIVVVVIQMGKDKKSGPNMNVQPQQLEMSNYNAQPVTANYGYGAPAVPMGQPMGQPMGYGAPQPNNNLVYIP